MSAPDNETDPFYAWAAVMWARCAWRVTRRVKDVSDFYNPAMELHTYDVVLANGREVHASAVNVGWRREPATMHLHLSHVICDEVFGNEQERRYDESNRPHVNVTSEMYYAGRIAQANGEDMRGVLEAALEAGGYGVR